MLNFSLVISHFMWIHLACMLWIRTRFHASG